MTFLILLIILLPFAVVLLVGAPYLPTRKAKAQEALAMMKLKKGDVFVDLGSGDGAVLVEAATQGLVCYGYELNPLMWLISKLRTLRFGSQVHVYCRNFWNIPLPKETKGVFVFLLDKYMAKLDRKLTEELKKGSVVASYTFQIPGNTPIAEKNAIYLYKY